MRIAALDLGSNTFLLTIAQVENKKIFKILHDETRVVKLGQGVGQTQSFNPQALLRARDCLSDYAQIIKDFDCSLVNAIATSAARDAKNGEELISIGQKLNIPIQILSGNEEAELTYLGSLFDQEESPGLLVVDIGGGSTEFIGRKMDGALYGKSLNIGSVRLTEKFLPDHPCSESQLKTLDFFIAQELKVHLGGFPRPVVKMVAVAGTPTSLVMLQKQIKFNEKFIHGERLLPQDIWNWRLRLAQLNLQSRVLLPGMQKDRADVLVAGVSILAAVADFFDPKLIMVSTKGIRYGVLLEQIRNL